MTPAVRKLGRTDYAETVAAMEAFTNQRCQSTPDEIWLLEHNPVYTQGTSCRQQPHHNPNQIPVLKTNRGGQITYHGPGQLIVYLLLDIKRLGLGPRSLVNQLEQTVIDLLAGYGIIADRRSGAPGIYVAERKIAALGLRIRNGCCFHGLSLNVDLDLAPFDDIDPCGYPDLEVTSLQRLGIQLDTESIGEAVADQLQLRLFTDRETGVDSSATGA